MKIQLYAVLILAVTTVLLTLLLTGPTSSLVILTVLTVLIVLIMVIGGAKQELPQVIRSILKNFFQEH